MLYDTITDTVGNTPLVGLGFRSLEKVNLFAKLEGYNPGGSIKDRPAKYILEKELESGRISKKTLIIESSSGNLGISLSVFARKLGLDFTCVIDPNINYINEIIIRKSGARVIKIAKPDKNGGYLMERISTVRKLLRANKNSYWVNQYANPLNAESYTALADELCDELFKIDYIFIAVSSGGTVTGISQRIKKKNPKTKIVAVDTVGSVIFGQSPKKRYIPGIGSSMKPEILKNAIIDDIVIVDELSAINACNELLSNYSIFAGGSSGSVFAAFQKYFQTKKGNSKINAVMIFADRGERYQQTIYNPAWVKNKFTS